MWDYYTKRWEIYIREATVAIISRKDFDHTSFRTQADKIQQKWVNSTEEVMQGTSEQDVLTHCRDLREKYRLQLDNWISN